MRKLVKLQFVIILLFILIQSSAYTTKDGIETGDEVNMDYVLSYDGDVQQNGPGFVTVVSSDRLIQGFYEGLLGMKVGQDKEIIVSPDKGYTDPSHDLYGKTLYFDVHINKIVTNINGGGEVTEVAEEFSETDSGILSPSSQVGSVIGNLFASPIFKVVVAIVGVIIVYTKFLT